MTLYDALLNSPSDSCKEPEIPDSVVCLNGLASCQHSNSDSPFAAVRAVRLRYGVVRLLSCAEVQEAREAKMRGKNSIFANKTWLSQYVVNWLMVKFWQYMQENEIAECLP